MSLNWLYELVTGKLVSVFSFAGRFTFQLFNQRFWCWVFCYSNCYLKHNYQQDQWKKNFIPFKPVTPEAIYSSVLRLWCFINNIYLLCFLIRFQKIGSINWIVYFIYRVNGSRIRFMCCAVLYKMNNAFGFFAVKIIRLPWKRKI